ncbi:ATP-binding cassette domain-containing protein [Paenibacillus cisolokensis]|uniref:ABC transporter ATP-binding protein n=1 Tax=Paenibacillus cisolokensis TaxID=1658519 RepID=UPI003D29D717
MKTDHPVNPAYLLRAAGLTKRFGSLTANEGIDLEVRPGQIHAILGENGAGKSTLMKMLYGVYEPDEGTVLMDGEPAVLYPPSRARAKGIGMVFQDFRLIPAMTVLESIALAVESGFALRRKQLRARILEVSRKYGLAVDPDAYVWQLDLGQRQRLEIVKVLLAPGTRVIIFDEPTSVLVPQEVEKFLDMLDKLRKDRYGILLITHKINEVLACADQVSVLRAGRMVYQSDQVDSGDGDKLISAMMGEKTLNPVTKQGMHGEEREPILQLKDGTVRGDHGEPVLEGVHLTLRKSEITGVAGISGNGQRELAEVLFGLRKLGTGELTIASAVMNDASTKEFMEAGVTFVSEDPIKESVIPGFTILEHMILDGIEAPVKGANIDWARAQKLLEDSEEARALALADGSRRADQLSGGNVQRMVLSRALIRKPDILIISYPSRGLDIGTTRTIQQQLIELAKQGTAVLLFSEDLDELFKLSDRLVVLSGKKLLGPYDTHETDVSRIGERMLKGESA